MRAVDGVSFAVNKGETLGLVGESGCGKSTLCRAVLQLLKPTSGSVRFEGREIAGLSRRRLRPLRREMQMIFQDPYASLNPRKRVGQIVGDPLKLQAVARGGELRDPGPGAARAGRPLPRALQPLPARVLRRPAAADRDRPGAGAGTEAGDLRRAGVGTRRLDQAQIVNLLDDLQDELGLTYVFVAHDIGVVRHVSDRIAVMNHGKIVEDGDADQVCEPPRDDYTKKLLAAVPIPDPRESRARRQASLRGRGPAALAADKTAAGADPERAAERRGVGL